jgi:TrmH family RNA methyltransferase
MPDPAARQISSRDNAQFKQLRELSRSARAVREQHQTLLLGTHLIQACLAAGHPIRQWVLGPTALGHEEVRACLSGISAPRLHLSAGLFRELSELPASQEIAALIDVPTPTGAPHNSDCVIALDGVQDAGNVGTILRSAAAAGYRAAWLGTGCAGAWSPKVLRAGQGAHFALDILEHLDLPARLSACGRPVFGAVANGGCSVFAAELTKPHVWVFGTEGEGISADVESCLTHRVTIPMAAGVESLNVAAAAAVCLFEAVRQRSG